MRNRWFLRSLGVACALGAVCSPARPAGACSCVGPAVLSLGLQLESVTRDGVPVADLSPWRDWDVTLRPLSSTNIELQARHRADERTYGEGYVRAP